MIVVLGAAIALIAGACGGSAATGSTGPTVPSVALPSGGGDFATSAKLEATLPTSVAGVALTTGSINVLQLYTTGNTAANILTLFVTGLGVSPAQVGVAGAVDSGGKIQIIAAQFNGVASTAIQAQVEAVAKGVDPNVALANTTIGGKPVTTATYPGSQTGPVVAYVTGDTMYLIQSSDPALVEDALKQLP
jgi:hypothetical protein